MVKPQSSAVPNHPVEIAAVGDITMPSGWSICCMDDDR